MFIDLARRGLLIAYREKDVSIKDFGTFKKIIQPARIARNPATGEPVEVPEKEVVKFKPSKNILNMKWL